MSELQALYRINKVLTDSEMVAARQLMQLSDEDNSNSINRKNKKKFDYDEDDDEEYDRSSQDEITSKKIEEIFGKEEDFIVERQARKKRFRSLQSIYKVTKPMKTA
uniref:Uncharacterized protein n=1 Tax=Manihot esculenta TaxID=3983 RepID=A0A2C9URB8_MANES